MQVRNRVDALLGLMKILTTKNSRAPPVAIRRIAKIFLDSICGYAAILYGSAPVTVLNKLETAVNRIVRLALGAFRTTPVVAMGVEMGFNIRNLVEERRISLVARNIVNPRSPHHKTVKRYADEEPTPKRPSAIKLAWDSYRRGGGPVPQIADITHTPMTGRDLEGMRVNIFPNMNRATTPSEAWVSRYREWRAVRPETGIYFTDASADEHSSTAAAVTLVEGNYVTVFRHELDRGTSASIAELYAIYRMIMELDGSEIDTMILSDSLGSIRSIFNPINHRYMPTCIREILLRNAGRIRLGWVPGHMGIEGNERADEAAKNGVGPTVQTTPPSEVFCRQRAMLGERARRQLVWDISNTFLREHWENPDPPALNQELNRKKTRALTRIRLGHTRLTKGHIMERVEPPRCQACGVIYTIRHILRECRETRGFFGRSTPPLAELLNPRQGSASQLFGLLERLGILRQI